TGETTTHRRGGTAGQPRRSPRHKPTAEPKRHPRDGGHPRRLAERLARRRPDRQAEVYREFGVRLTYNHTEHTVLAETRPTSSVCVVFVSEGDTNTETCK